MIKCRIGGMQCKISVLFPVVFLYLLKSDTSGMIVCGFLAAFIHETAHLLVMTLCNIRPKELLLSFFGMRIVINPRVMGSLLKYFAVYMAGPFSNLLCAAVLACTPLNPQFIFVHILMASINLLPIIPLDGGQVIQTLLEQRCSEQLTQQMLWIFTVVTILPLTVLGIAVLVQPPHNPTPCLLCMYLLCMKLFYKGN